HLSIHSIKEIAENCTRLEELSLQGISGICDEDLKHVIRKVGAQLTRLILDGNLLTDKSFCFLKHCTRLQVLDMTCCRRMTDRGLLEGIGALQKLRLLKLQLGLKLTTRAFSTFLNRPAMACIIYLHLYCCPQLDDYGLEGIANRCVNLRTLYLNSCYKVTDAGILKLICNCKKLQILELIEIGGITGTGCLDLIPTHLPLLKKLNSFLCRHVPDELLLKLASVMPQLEVINHNGYRVPVLKEEQFRSRIHREYNHLYSYIDGDILQSFEENLTEQCRSSRFQITM
ncbi:hypothetical protein L9F63_008278, partial [Diploptera punctata]